MYKCDHCDFKSERIWCINRHVKNKHNSQTGSGAKQPHVDSDPVVSMEQTAPSQPQIEMHSNQQEENVDQLYENIDQWQKAYETLKLQFIQSDYIRSRKDSTIDMILKSS